MGLTLQSGAAALGIHGRLSLTVLDTAWFEAHRGNTELIRNPPADVVRDHQAGDNIMCTAGVSAIAAALVWSGVQDQATALGLTSPTYLTPLWGAVGSGSGTVAASDVALFSELGRQTVGAGAAGPATASIPASVTWLFYFPQPSVAWTVTEAGVFANGSSDPSTPQSAGVMLDHWAVSPPVPVPTTDTLILQSSFSFTGM